MRFVKAATLDRLVDALVTDDGELESTFVNVFLGEHPHSNLVSSKIEFLHVFSLLSSSNSHSDVPNVHQDGKSFGTSAAAV